MRIGLLLLPQVQAATESRDLRKTKAAVDKAIPKIREAAFTSSGCVRDQDYGMEGGGGVLVLLLALVNTR